MDTIDKCIIFSILLVLIFLISLLIFLGVFSVQEIIKVKDCKSKGYDSVKNIDDGYYNCCRVSTDEQGLYSKEKDCIKGGKNE